MNPTPAHKSYDVVIIGGAMIGSSAAFWLTRNPAFQGRVLVVERDQLVMPTNVQDDATWGIDRIDQRSLPRDTKYSYNNTAEDVVVYVLDTGVDATHSEFGGRVTTGFSAFTGESPTQDCASGHGTHVAGTVAGSTYGVAKSATVVPVKVLSCITNSYVSDAIDGINWIIENHVPGTKAVANLSLSTGISQSLNNAVTNLMNSGVVVAVAAANNNADACNYSPASAPAVLTVGASTVGDTKASFSNYGSCVDLFAPGYLITSAKPGGGSQTMSGTSMASPHVAGAAAVLWSGLGDVTHSVVTASLLSNVTANAVTHSGTTNTYPLLHLPTEITAQGATDPEPAAPAATTNDDFANPYVLSGSTGSLTHNNTTATVQVNEPAPIVGNGAASLWYAFTNGLDGSLNLDLSGSDFDTVLEVFTGSSLLDLRRVASDDDSGDGLASRLSVETSAGTNYFIRVTSWDGSRGDLVVTWNFAALAPPSAPPAVVVLPRTESAIVKWNEPASGVTSDISYTVVESTTNRTCSVVAHTQCEISGLEQGQQYSFSVRATNKTGPGAWSDPVVVTLQDSGVQERTTTVWGLDRIDQRELPLDGDLIAANKGTGVRVYVVDTGVKANHSEFTGRVTSGIDLVGDGYGTDDCDGHGTHVASTAAGATYGIASEAVIVPVRVLDCGGSGNISQIVAGLDWIRSDLRTGTLAVVNMSLGAATTSLMMTEAVNALTEAGVVVVVAAGNETVNACGTTPAGIASAITVASSTITDELSSFSNYGGCVDVIAPGSNIRGAGISTTTSTVTMSGTSMASPHVAGVAAVIARELETTNSTQITNAIISLSTPDVFATLPTGTPNRLLYVPSNACEIRTGEKTGCEGETVGQPVPETPVPETPTPETPTPETPAPQVPIPQTPPPVAGAPVVQQPIAQTPVVTAPVIVRRTLAITNRKQIRVRGLLRRARAELGTTSGTRAKVRKSSRGNCTVRNNRVVFLRSGRCVVVVDSATSSVRAVIKLSVRR